MKTKLDNLETWQRASVVTSLILTVVLILNTSLMAYMNYQDTFTASMAPTGAGETLEISLKTEAGRPSPLAYYLREARSWISAYFVSGTDAENATTGIIVAIDGTNIAASASVDYYIEARESTGQGSSYRFLEGNSTSVTVNGADLDLSNETSIENHLTAMGLSTSSSWTIDYYVYVKAEATGAVSGETLTSEITYQQFDSVTYEYGAEITENYQVAASGDDLHTLESYDWITSTGSYLRIGDDRDVYYDYTAAVRFLNVDIDQGQDIESADLKLYVFAGTGDCTMKVTGEDVGSAGAISTRTAFLSASRTSESVQWTPSTWSEDTWKTVNVTTIIQALLDRGDFSSGSNMRLFMEDASSGWGGSKSDLHFTSYDTSTTHAAKLTVSYIGYAASWYPIGPVSVLSMPLGQTLGAVTVLAISCYAVYSALHKEEKKK